MGGALQGPMVERRGWRMRPLMHIVHHSVLHIWDQSLVSTPRLWTVGPSLSPREALFYPTEMTTQAEMVLGCCTTGKGETAKSQEGWSSLSPAAQSHILLVSEIHSSPLNSPWIRKFSVSSKPPVASVSSPEEKRTNSTQPQLFWKHLEEPGFPTKHPHFYFNCWETQKPHILWLFFLKILRHFVNVTQWWVLLSLLDR